MSVNQGSNRSETFTFAAIPQNVAELRAIPEANLQSPFASTALALLVLCRFEQDAQATFEMLDYLKGPAPVSPFEKQFLTERLRDKYYKPFSFFHGATPANSYTPDQPLTITVSANPYSFDNEDWAVLWVKSGGADSPRQIKLRRKPSTGEWFINEIQCLSDIRVPAAEDPWA